MPIVTVELGVTDMRYATKALAITSHVRPVVNSRLLAITRSKLWCMGKALSRKSASQRKQIFNRWQSNCWNVELNASELRSVVMEENARLVCQLERKALQVEKLKEENSIIREALEKTKDENSCLQNEVTSEKSRKEELQHELDETRSRIPLQDLNSTSSRKRKYLGGVL